MPRNCSVPERWRLGEDFVPKGRYIDREFLQLEYAQLFAKTWQMACRVEEIPAVGSFLEYEIGDQSILVVRSATDRIQAFYNTCIHRGAQLAKDSGRVSEFRCPFHGWRYSLDGRCSFIHLEQEFLPRPVEFKRLRELRCELWGGWVFVNMDRDAELEFVPNWPDGDWGQVLGQDFRNMADVQRGMHSRGFEGQWLNTRQEMTVHDAHRIADRFLFGVDA